jgi:hypothetical protein
MMKSVRHGLITILLSILFLPLSALAAPLSELIASGASITVGDKLFSNFSGSLSFGIGNQFPDNLSQVEVFGLPGNNEHGLAFRAAFFAEAFEGALALDVAFDVTVLDPPHRIHDITLVLASAAFLGEGCVSAGVGRLISINACEFEGDPFDGPLTASRPFSSNTPVRIDTAFGLAATCCTGSDGVFSQGFAVTFSQSVAEPSIVLLLVFGAVLIAAIAHRFILCPLAE